MAKKRAAPRGKRSVLSMITEDEAKLLKDGNPLGIPEISASASVAWALDWAINQVRIGREEAIQQIGERMALVAVIHAIPSIQWSPQTSGNDIARAVSLWFTRGDGQDWTWPKENQTGLCSILSGLSDTVALGLLCWAQEYWVRRQRGEVLRAISWAEEAIQTAQTEQAESGGGDY